MSGRRARFRNRFDSSLVSSLSKLLVRLSKSRDKIDEDKYLNTLSRLLYLFAMKRNEERREWGVRNTLRIPARASKNKESASPIISLSRARETFTHSVFPWKVAFKGKKKAKSVPLKESFVNLRFSLSRKERLSRRVAFIVRVKTSRSPFLLLLASVGRRLRATDQA